MLNPLILVAAKSSFDEIFQVKAYMGKYLKGKCESEHYQQLSFKYLYISIFNNNVIVKSIIDPDNNFWRNS